MYCNYCDPKFFIIYGFCGNCQRRCQPPLFDKETMNILDYEELKKNWNKERPDLMLDAIRMTEAF